MEYGGMDGTNLGMAVIREHLACKGLGLHRDLQNEHAIVGNNVGLLMLMRPEPAADQAKATVSPRSSYPFGKPLAANQAIQFPLVELQTQCEMLRALIHKTAWTMDTYGTFSRAHLPSPPALPHHRRFGRNPDAPRRRLHFRLHEAAGP
jgi:alkylation response protein AidB-like acyl-CoA dehydrogenase